MITNNRTKLFIISALLITLSNTLSFAADPDIRIQSINITFSSPDTTTVRGSTISIFARIDNNGAATLSSCAIHYDITNDGASITGSGLVDSIQKKAQSFQTKGTMYLQDVELYCNDTGGVTGEDLTVEIQSDDGSGLSPSGSVLATGSASGSTSPHWQKFTLTVPYTLAANTVYWIVVYNTEGENQGWVWAYDSAGSYSLGYAYYSSYGGAWAAMSGYDFLFKLYGKPVTVSIYDDTDTVFGGGTQIGTTELLSPTLGNLKTFVSTVTWRATPGRAHYIWVDVTFAGIEGNYGNNRQYKQYNVSQAPPDNISNLTALTHPTTQGAINLQWTAPGEDLSLGRVSQYVLKYSSVGIITSGNFNNASTYTFPKSSMSFVYGGNPENVALVNLIRGATYWFALKASDGDTVPALGNGPRWNVWRSSTEVSGINTLASTEAYDAVPGAPRNLSAIAGPENIVSLSWDAPVGGYPDDFLKFQLYCDNTLPYDFGDQFLIHEGSNTFVHQNLSILTTYYAQSYSYRVRTADQGPKILYSGYSNTKSTGIVIPAAPKGFAGTALSTGSIHWAWTDYADKETGFYIKVTTSGDVLRIANRLNNTGLTGTWDEQSLALNTQYNRSIQSYNYFGTSPTVAIPDLTYTLANKPTSTYVLGVSSVTVNLKWFANYNPSYTRWGILRSTTNFVSSTTTLKDFSSAFTPRTLLDTGLSPLTTYWYKVCGYNGDGIPTAYDVTIVTRTNPGIPPPPNDFGGVPVSTRTIHWAWSDVSSGGYRELGFRVVSSTGGIMARLTQNVTFWTQRNLQINTSYTMHVEPYNEVGYSVSNSSMRYTLANAPTGTYTITTTSRSITIGWLRNNNPTYTRWGIIRGSQLDNFVSSTTIRSFSNAYTAITLTDLELQPDCSYWYRVRGFNGEGIPTAYDILIQTMTKPAPPVPPRNFLGTALSTGSISWSWIDNSINEDGFRVFNATAGLKASFSSTGGVGTTIYWSEAGLQLNTSYYRFAHAYNRIGVSSSNADICYTLARQPTYSYVISVTSYSASLGWQNNGNPSHTEWGIIRSTTNFIVSTNTVLSFANHYKTPLNYQNRGLEPLTTYWYKIRAFNGDGIGTAYDVVIVTRTNPGPPQAPTDFGGVAVTTTSIHWSWTDNSDGKYREVGFRVKNSTGGIKGNLAANVTFWTEGSLRPNTSYYRYAEAYNETAFSVSNSSVIFTLANPPTGSYVIDVTPISIQLGWFRSDNPAYTKWGIFCSTTNFTVSTTTVLSFLHRYSSATYLHEDLEPSTTYWYKIFAYNENGIPSLFDLTIATITEPSSPRQPLNFRGVAVSTTSIKWTWKDNSNYEDGFRVRASTKQILALLPANVTFWIETGLRENASYYAYCESYNITGSSASNSDIRYTLANPPSPLLTYTSSPTYHTAMLTWNDNKITRLMIQISSATPNFTVSTDTRSWEDNYATSPGRIQHLYLNTTYYFGLWAYNGDGVLSSTRTVIRGFTADLPSWITKIYPNLGGFQTYYALINNTEVEMKAVVPVLTVNQPVYILITPNALVNPQLERAEDITAAKGKIDLLPNRHLLENTATEFNMYDFWGSTITAFNKNVTLTIQYPDEDNNGLVDDPVTKYREETLLMMHLNSGFQEWEDVTGTTVDEQTNAVTAEVSHFSMYSIASNGPAGGFYARIYPNPFKPNSNIGHTLINFTGLQVGSTLRVYDLAGNLVYKREDLLVSDITWDATNNSGKKIASGVYVYVVTDTDGSRQIGNFAIIR